MNFEFLIFEKRGGKAYITINRPNVFNALNTSILQELAQVITACITDSEVRVLILTGSGDKAFCSGADLKESLSEEQLLGERLKAYYEPVILALRNIPKPVICKMNGIAAGAGMSLALACDLIVADESAYMTELFIGIGLMPDAGSLFFLPRLVGMQRAFELCSTTRKILMPEALQLGLISQMAPANELDALVERLADQFAISATVAIGEMKKVLNSSFNCSLSEILDMEAEGQSRCGQSADFSEGIVAFLEKRRPVFSGE